VGTSVILFLSKITRLITGMLSFCQQVIYIGASNYRVLWSTGTLVRGLITYKNLLLVHITCCGSLSWSCAACRIHKDMELECLATWKDGSDTFLYGRLSGINDNDDDGFRCFVRVTTNIFVSALFL